MPVTSNHTDEGPPFKDKKKLAIGILCLVVVAVSLLSLLGGIRSQNAKTAALSRTSGGGAPGGRGYPGAGAVGGRQMPPGTRGQITAVSAGAITIQGRDGAAQTFTLTPATKITVDQNPVAAMDLKAGQRARVISADNKSADEIHIRTRPFGGRGGRGGPPGGYPGGAPVVLGTS